MINVLADPFFNCHTHSEMSNLRLKDCTIKVKDAIQYVANTLGQTGYVLADHDCLSNHLKVLNTVKELKANGKIAETFKVGLGNEIYLLFEDEMREKLANKEYVTFYHFILIALDDVGHRQLRELSSRAWERMFTYKSMDRVPTFKTDIEEIVGVDKGHIIASTACLGGELAKSIMNENYERAYNFISWCQTVFGEDNFYLEMQPHDPYKIVDGLQEITEQQVVNEWIAKQGLPTVITTDAHYLKQEDRVLHESYLKSDEDDETVSGGGREVSEFYATTYFMGVQELRDRLGYLDDSFFNQCIKNTYDIYERINFNSYYSLFKNQVIPEVQLPPKEEWFWSDEIMEFVEDNNFENILKLVDSDNEYDKYIICRSFEGLQEKIKREDWFSSLKRFDLEMSELIGVSNAKDAVMSAYFITMQKFIDIIWEEAQSLVGVSRGSGAGWITNYLLGITQINPLEQPAEMPHWRSINRTQPPVMVSLVLGEVA